MGSRAVLLALAVTLGAARASAEPAASPDVPAPPTRDAEDDEEPLPPPPPAPPPAEPPRGDVAPSSPPGPLVMPEAAEPRRTSKSSKGASPSQDEVLPGFDAEPRPKTERRWYGYQTLIADGFALGLIVAGADSRGNGEAIGFGVGTYFLGAPIVHAVHGHVDKAFGSLGLRLIPPLLAVVALSGSSGRGDSYGPALALGVLAIPAAIVIDAAVIAREDVEPEKTGFHPRLRVSPFVAHRGAGGGVSVGFDL